MEKLHFFSINISYGSLSFMRYDLESSVYFNINYCIHLSTHKTFDDYL